MPAALATARGPLAAGRSPPVQRASSCPGHTHLTPCHRTWFNFRMATRQRTPNDESDYTAQVVNLRRDGRDLRVIVVRDRRGYCLGEFRSVPALARRFDLAEIEVVG